jgi:hypothetical protein
MEDTLGLFDFSMSGLISALLFGVIGMYIFGHGKRTSNIKLILIAVALMFYPYFTKGPIADWGVGLALCGGAYWLWDQ